MKPEVPDTHQKARRINLDAALRGTFTEAGAAQEVARWFTRGADAPGMIAKAVSLYDVAFADALYGRCEAAASQQRLEAMLMHEFDLLREQLGSRRGGGTAFFAFASAAEARYESRPDEAHAWIGIRFQFRPRTLPSQVTVHVRLRDPDPVRNHEALGILGVNLVYGVRESRNDPEALLLSLLDNLVTARLKIDRVEFSGPAFPAADNGRLNLKLVEHGFTDAPLPLAQADPLCHDRHRVRRAARPVRGGLIDSLHLAGMPKAA